MADFVRFLQSASRMQQWILRILVLLFFVTLIILLRRFYLANSMLVPARGGTYIEGSVGQLNPLNPWFTMTNNVNRDIVSLVFSGLLKYDPATKSIEGDLADYTVSDGGKTYTLTLKENIFWHDSTPEAPHPVTPEDVLFTFKTIQDPAFPNSLLHQNFLGVSIEKIDDRTVRFKLEEPYSFFPSNLTLGLVPKNAFEGVPIGKLDQTLDFGFRPIGAGPYAFKDLVQTELSTEVTLERFARVGDPEFRLKQIVFRIFPDYTSLLADIRNLDGVRHVPRTDKGEPIVPKQFKTVSYTLPQYVALFFNLERPLLQEKQLRLGLQLGTNKQAIVDAIGESEIVDTPLLEIDTSDWRYSFDPLAAQGALFESKWHLPEKVRLQRLLEMHEANVTGALKFDPIMLLDTGSVLTFTGAVADAPIGSRVNGVPVVPTSETGTWIVALPTVAGTGSIHPGSNLIRLQDIKGKILDSAYVWRTTNAKEFKRADTEQDLLDAFLLSRAGKLPEAERIGVQDLYVEQGMLRRRTPSDPTDIRVNDEGDRLSLTLLTSATPEHYRTIAEAIRDQWAKLGVHVGIVIPETREEFEKKLISRDYDILLYGQSLLDNLDSYPYWHSDGLQNGSGELRLDAYNFSQYSSLLADTLLKVIRQTSDEQERKDSLKELKTILSEDVPAVFLYSPLYAFAYHQDVQGIELGALSLHSDRFLSIDRWYLKQERLFMPGRGWLTFFPWLLGLTQS